MTKTTQKPTQTIPIVLKNTFVASNALPSSTQSERLAKILGKQQLTGFVFGTGPAGRVLRTVAFLAAMARIVLPAIVLASPPPSFPLLPQAQNTPTDPNRTTSALIYTYVRTYVRTYLMPDGFYKNKNWMKKKRTAWSARLHEDNGKFSEQFGARLSTYVRTDVST